MPTLSERSLQIFDQIRPLPGEEVALRGTTEVTVGRGLAIDRLVQAQMRSNTSGGHTAELVDPADRRLDRRVGNHTGTMRVDIERKRVADPNGVGQLDGAALRQPGRDDVLGKVARDVGGRAVDLGRILARESTAAMRRGAAVGINDDLAAGKAGVAVRPADLEAAGRIDMVDRLSRKQVSGNPLATTFLT